MILSQAEIRTAVEKDEIRFDPPLEKRQWAEASVNLRLGLKFTKWKEGLKATFPLSQGIRALAEIGLWHEKVLRVERRIWETRNIRS